ncbi:RagB/SusD family nutrient uptake outer membrane protein [uncultured Alistipes sp.]|uniref:RagB/SusD family nutrient uptake outer membrane protein n=1 Tax=uncultured Alistipes sp. TaxID=538949 RepID=UPI00262B451F|nr:RagB/SusD family nutrient uptake outer membrane protein [uncultured Alistipes sp.]
MKIRNILAILTLGMVSCVGLEQFPTNSFTDENYWKYDENVRAALYLGYNQCWSHEYYFNNNLLSDDVYGSRHSPWGLLNVATGMANTTVERFSKEWNDCYQELRTLHTALDAEDRIDTGDPVFKTRMLAELRLMRAFTYLRLVTWFGDVPFYTTNPTLAESRVTPPTSAATIKQFIHEELAYAASILPKNTEIKDDERGRYTCGTAIAIKARAYLLDNDFENCAKECAKLINTTEYGTYALEEDYAKLFREQSCCYGPESIMTIEFATLDGINNIVRSWDGKSWLPQSIGNKGVTSQSPTQELVDAFLKLDGSVADDTDYISRDKRFYTTIAYNGCEVEIPEAMGLGLTGSEGKGKGTYTMYTNASQEEATGDKELYDSYNGSQDRTATGYYALKNFNPTMMNSGGNSYKSIMEIRFADILLMYAESKNELGEMSEEIWNQTIKPLRERAGFGETYCAYPGGNDLRQIIRDERRVELALEGRRVFDLRRWAVLDNPSIKSTGTAILTSQATGAPFRSGESIICQNKYGLKYWFAIPQSERDINSNLPQNPGW